MNYTIFGIKYISMSTIPKLGQQGDKGEERERVVK
jgi:hypothetical protein